MSPTKPRTWAPVVDQHATWLAVNPLQGCPKACAYCFLNERGQTAVRPEQLANPPRTVELLLGSDLYSPERAVALYTWTDVMALPASRAHLAELLGLLAGRRLPNPVVLITKCHVPPDTVERIAAARAAGLQVLVYVSYSGLGRDVERGIRHEAVRGNFPALADAGIPVVHYWRPAFPESAVPATMHSVLGLARRYARCTVAAGLKVEPAALPRLRRLWPELAEAPGVTQAEGVYPRAFWEFLAQADRHAPGHPLFHTNACALAYVLGQTDRFAVFGTPVCRERNHCPAGQRERCQRAADTTPPPSDTAVRRALDRRGLVGAAFTYDAARRELGVDAPATNRVVAALTQDLGVRVRTGLPSTDPYWSSGTAGALPLVLE